MINNSLITGYIEGYYGKLLSWNDRFRILENLEKNKMKYYFYAPKEDVNHRLYWRQPYDQSWMQNLKEFVASAKMRNIRIIFGIAPGLDFDFNSLIANAQSHNDLNVLINKFKNISKIGVEEFAILFDDLQPDFKSKYPSCPPEGECHAILSNKVMSKIKSPFFVVPRVYSKQIMQGSQEYLSYFGKKINLKANIFFCGKHIVSEKINQNDKKFLKKFFKNNVTFWDNFYSNDYCPKKIFLGPWVGRKNLDSVLINGTGMIEIDILIIQIVHYCNINNNKLLAWKSVIIKNNIPEEFFNILIYFDKPNFGTLTKLKYFKYDKLILRHLETLLWKWKTPLSRELYPFLMSLKHDLLLQRKKLPLNRIIKTQSLPLADLLLKNYRR